MGQNIDKKTIIVRMISRLNIGGPAIHTILLTEGVSKEIFKTYFVAGRPEPLEGNMAILAEQNIRRVDSDGQSCVLRAPIQKDHDRPANERARLSLV